MYEFDNVINRKGSNCVKWDVPFVTDGVIPMWIADMDFEVAPAIKRNLMERVEHGVFGYQFLSERYYQSIINWMKNRHNLEVKREWICYVPNVVLGITFAIQSISEPGDEFIIHTPVYGPFYRAIEDTGRVVVESRMKNQNGYYTIDFEDFERKITSKTKAFILCNPHNPVGRVWKRSELEKIVDICERHNLYIISDDIHSELITKNHRHTFVSEISEGIAEKSFIFTSPSKAFNLASVHVANCFIRNAELREKFEAICEKSHAAENNAFSEAALLGAYEESQDWLDELNEYIEGNLDCIVTYIQEYIPQITVYKPEGTYLLWLDLRNLGLLDNQIYDFLLKDCHLAVNDGTFFGEEGKGFVRMNAACPRTVIMNVLEKLKEEIEKLG